MNKKLCCENAEDYPGPIAWNPFNKVVQCHSCGHIYVKQSRLQNLIDRLLNIF